MTSDNQKLWLKIQDFRFDKEGTTLTFANRLAKEQGWDDNYTQRVIEEYKKFLFLCCISSDMMTPSEPVDQVWHLHLTYTKSYWEDLCRDTLGKELHHHPTKGGAEENLKFKQLYKKTRAFYTLTFGSDPPQDIWGNPQSSHSPKQRTQNKANTRRNKQTPVKGGYIVRQVAIVLISIVAVVLRKVYGWQSWVLLF